MRFSVYALVASMPLLLSSPVTAAAAPMLLPAAKQSSIVAVNFIDRLLQGNAMHRSKSTTHRRKQRHAQDQMAASPSDPASNIPVPLPKPKPETATPVPSPKPSEAPPEPKADAQTPAPEPGKSDHAVETVPQKAEEPAIKSSKEQEGEQNKNQSKDQPKEQTDGSGGSAMKSDEGEDQPEIVHENPDDLKACLSDLKAAGAKFENAPAIHEENGCGIEQPIKVDTVLPGLSVGGAIMRCRTALSLAHWLKDSVQPALDVARPGRKIVGIVAGTTFACRLRNNAASGMISEHARGNAFDVAAFRLDNDETVEMKPRADDHTMEGAFQQAATAGACLYFTTVLAPGSDAAHETHLHVDIRERKNGYRICDQR